MTTDPELAALLARLASDGPALAAEVLAAIYRDPFWRARFGARADEHGSKDGLHHLAYVREALAAGSPDVIAHYARWLQSVLTTRGMCSRHLADHFDRLAAAILAAGWPGAARAAAVLAAATAALRYPEGPARALADRIPALPAELATLASYTSDALALGAPDTLVAHVAWCARSGHIALTALRDQLTALAGALPADDPARALLAAAAT